MKLLFWLAIIFSSVFCLVLVRGYAGDSVIYLCFAKNILLFHPFSFNPGEFSSGATSPVWPFVLTPALLFSDQFFVAKLIGLAILLFAIKFGAQIMPDTNLALLGLAFIFYWIVFNAILFYETPLFVLVSFLALSGKRWAWGFLPLIRPEAIVIALVWLFFPGLFPVRVHARRSSMWILLPALTMWLVSYLLTGYFSTSVVFRAKHILSSDLIWIGYKRYATLFLPFLVFVIVQWHYRATYHFARSAGAATRS